MRCEAVLGALAAGESSPALAAHVAGCPRCTAAQRWMIGGGAVDATPPTPSIRTFRGRERRERGVRLAGMAAAIALVLAIVVANENSRPPEPLAEGPWDVLDGVEDEPLAGLFADPLRAPMFDELVDPDPLADLSDPTDLFDVARSGEGSL